MEEGRVLAGHPGSSHPPGDPATSKTPATVQTETTKEEADLLERHTRKMKDKEKEKEIPPPSFKDALISVGTTTAQMDEVPETLEHHDSAPQDDEDGIPTITITNADLDRIRKPWSTSIIIRVIGRSFGHEYLLSKLQTLWKPSENLTCLELGDHFVLVRFHSQGDMTKVLNEGPWFIGPHYITIRKWEPEFDTSKAKISTSVIWVRLPGLPIEFYDKEMLLKIGTKIGKPLKIDFRTENNEKVRFARLCVQVDLSSSLISKVRVGNHIQKVSYEGIPTICFKCGLSGHKLQHCSPPPLPPRLQHQPKMQNLVIGC
ncbi:hypothetical protein C3L33_18815, partial [Rhododendron williamsianum]